MFTRLGFSVGNMCFVCAPAATALLIVPTRGHQTAATCSASVLTKTSLSIPSAVDSHKHTFFYFLNSLKDDQKCCSNSVLDPQPRVEGASRFLIVFFFIKATVVLA